MAGTGRPGEWGGVDQPNPEIRDDSYLNNVGGMSSVQPREEANSAEGAPDLNPSGDKSQLGPPIWNRKTTEATKNLTMKLRRIGFLLVFLNVCYPLTVSCFRYLKLVSLPLLT